MRCWLFGLLVFTLNAHSGEGPVVKIDTGRIQGTQEGDLWVYRGIPYAAPPVGENRWRAPQPVRPWRGILPTDAFGASCMQTRNPMFGTADISVSEDCLFLNVWTPARPGAKAKLPVMVWIHGGGFSFGTTAQALYSGEKLAERGVVFVSMNYRFGPFGFLAHPQLSAESGHASSGNYGILDQIAALQWVQRNVEAFGGDRHNVTVIGESAGGISVSILAASPLAADLFQAAISQSGGSFGPTRTPSMPGENLYPLAAAESAGQDFAAKLGANGTGAGSLEAMRAIDAERIHEAARGTQGVGWPIVDGYVIPGDQYVLYQQGKFNDTPVLIGINSDEGATFSRVRTLDEHVAYVRNRFGPWAERILALYPADSDTAAVRADRDLMRDLAFGWHTWVWARLQTEAGNSPVYYYYFDQRPPYPDVPRYRGVRAPHGAELPYMFGHLGQSAQRLAWTEDDSLISDAMVTYWTNFAKRHDPSSKGEARLPSWPAFTDEDPAIMLFNERPQPSQVPNPDQLRGLNAYFEWRRTPEGKAFGASGS